MVAAFGLPIPKLIITMSSATATFMALSLHRYHGARLLAEDVQVVVEVGQQHMRS
jgi:hypothetical protein